jgi:sodium-independent sulfate anion transporter 11
LSPTSPLSRAVEFKIVLTPAEFEELQVHPTKKKKKKKKSEGHKNPPIKILLTVPSGLHDLGAPDLSSNLVGKVASRLPVVVLILVLEHVAIAKCFGRLNDYVINPNQEFIAIGIANVVGSFFSSYPATGSFSRTAIKAKAGVRSPLAGMS